MTPKLLAISGPLRGCDFLLHSGEFAIGRESSNAIWLEHSSVSRRHCTVRVQAGRYAILDIDSRNGTFVNNVPVKERELENGDEVRIGEYVFLFLTKESSVAAGPAAVIDESKLLTRSIILKPEDSLYVRKASLDAELREAAGGRAADIARYLNALLGAREAIHSLGDTESISRQLLQSAFEVAPAQRGSVTLFDALGSGERAAFGWERKTGAIEAVR